MAQTHLGSRNPNFPQVQTARKLVGSRAPHLETSKLETSKTTRWGQSFFVWLDDTTEALRNLCNENGDKKL